MLVVAQRTGMYVGPKIDKVVVGIGIGMVTVYVAHPPKGDAVRLSAMAGIGTYHAVLVSRADGDSVYKVRIESEVP